MLPIETRISIPTDISSFQNTPIPDGNQSQMCLLPSNLNKHIPLKQHRRRNVNHHIHSELVNKYIAPFQSEWGINNKMMPFGYYLQSNQYINENNGNLHQILPFSVPLDLSFTSLESSVSTPNCNGVYSNQKVEYEKRIQPCPFTNQQHIWRPSNSLPTVPSSSITTSVIPPAKTKRKYTRKVHQPLAKQQLSQYPNTSADSTFPNCWSSLPLPSMTDTLARPNEYTFPVDLMRTPNFAPLSLPNLPISSDSASTIIDSKSNSITVQQHSLPHSTTNTIERYQTSGQCLSDQRFSHVQNTIYNCSKNNLSYNLPYFLTAPHERYYMLPSNQMSINIPTMACSTLMPELNTTFSPLSFSNNMKKVRKKRDSSQKSEVVQNSAVESQLDEKIPNLRRCLQKKSGIEHNRAKTLIKHMKQRTKLAVLKFLMRKRKQQISKNKLSEVTIENIVPPMVDTSVSKTEEMNTKFPNVIASNLTIAFNAAQEIESISLYYHQRYKPELKTKHSLVTSNNAENKLDLLIEAVNFIETYNGSSKPALESLE